MRILKVSVAVLATFALCIGSAFADGNSPVEKSWNLEDITSIGSGPRTDVVEVEPNDTCTTAQDYTCGDKLVGAVRPAGDVDWYCIQTGPNELLTVGTEAAGIGTDTVIELFAADCVTSVAFDDDGGPGLFSLIEDFDTGAGGPYYLKVIEFGNNGEVDYNLISSCRPLFVPGFCPLGEYKAGKTNADVAIPDGTGEFIELNPIVLSPLPGFVITDVVIDLNMEHTWVGDLIIILKRYDDAGNVIAQTTLVDRPGVPDIGAAGCSGDMISDPENKYYFSDRPDLEPLGFPECPSVLDPACYQSVGSMDPFRGLPLGGGYWGLCISDNVGFDTGFVYNWSVHALAEAPISVEESSWGDIKASYKE